MDKEIEIKGGLVAHVILEPDKEFELPYKKNKEGYYQILPSQSHIGGKNVLRDISSKKIKEGYIYFIQIIGTNKYKIGVSTVPKKRLAAIASVLPFELQVLALNKIKNPYDFEQKLINKYIKYLIKNEWFNLEINQARDIMITLHNQQVLEHGTT